MRLVTLNGMRHVSGLHYSPDGRRLLAVGGQMELHIDEARWVDVADGCETLQIPLFAACYAVSPDLSRLAVGCRRLREPHSASVPPVVTFDSTDPAWLEDESRRKRVGMTVLERDHGTHINAVAFDPTGERLAVATSFNQFDGGFIAIWYLQVVTLGRGDAPVLAATSRASSKLIWTPNGSALVSVGAIDVASTVATWDAVTLDLGFTFTPPSPQTRQPTFSPDGGTLAVPNGKAAFLLPADFSAPRAVLRHHKHGVECVTFTPDGRRVLTTSTDKLVRIWDAASGHLLTSYDFGVGGTTAVAVAPNGLTAAVAGQRGKVVLFDLDG